MELWTWLEMFASGVRIGMIEQPTGLCGVGRGPMIVTMLLCRTALRSSHQSHCPHGFG